MKRIARSAGAVVVALGAMIAAVMVVPQAASASDYCEPQTTRSYRQTSFSWYAYDSGTLNNTSSGTISKSFTHTANKSFTTTVSSEAGASASLVVVEINAKLGLSVAVTASYTTSTTFKVTAPPHTTISYKDGIARRIFTISVVQTYSNCNKATRTGSAQVADNYSEARNA